MKIRNIADALIPVYKVDNQSILFFNFRWFCHFDDDNYVNVPALVRKLQYYDHNKDWYLGKPSIPEPLEIMDREHNNVSIFRLMLLILFWLIMKYNIIDSRSVEDRKIN